MEVKCTQRIRDVYQDAALSLFISGYNSFEIDIDIETADTRLKKIINLTPIGTTQFVKIIT